MQPSNQCFPKSFKAPTVDRIHALQKGMRRKRPKLSHSASKIYAKRKQINTPSDAQMICARKYRPTLNHLM